MKKNNHTDHYTDKLILEKDNIIGSLRNDVIKLYAANSKLTQKNNELHQNINKCKASSKRTASQLLNIKASASWKTGHLIIKSFRAPGLNTLLLPLRLIKLFFNQSRKKWRNFQIKNSSNTTKTSQTSPSPFEQSSPAANTKSFLLRKNITADNLSSLRIACIMDEFTYKSFSPECKLLQLTPNNWLDEICGFEPDMLFIQSAWAGKNDLWLNKIKYPGKELKNLVNWCKGHNVPTIFRSTEDPPHFNDFLSAASLCDIIFTTDINCIKKYKTLLQSDRVYLLPFAVQPRRFNPVEKYERKMAFCFAGAYYPNYPERQKDLDFLFTALSTLGEIDIFDRNYSKNNNLMIFPDRFKHRIVGDLSYNMIDFAYKGYKFGININSVKNSPTMFARRVYELLASNTVIVSNYSRGIQLIFGDLVINSANKKHLTQQLDKLITDDDYYKKFILLGLRKVLRKHTYEDRLAFMAHKIWGLQHKQTLHHVCVIASASSDIELNRIVKSYNRQTYANKSLLVIKKTNFQTPPHLPNESITFSTREKVSSNTINDFVKNGFVAGFFHNDYYGPNYLLDIMLSTRYSPSSVIGKGAFYKYHDNVIILQNYHNRYHLTNTLPLRSSAFSSKIKKNTYITNFLNEIPAGYIEEDNCLSIDEFNYCKNYKDDSCPTVDDIQIKNDGVPLSEIISHSVENS